MTPGRTVFVSNAELIGEEQKKASTSMPHEGNPEPHDLSFTLLDMPRGRVKVGSMQRSDCVLS